MKKIRVADYIMQRAVEAGIKHAFLVTGGGAMHLNDAIGRNSKLTPICFHHEQAAAMAAESYFRVSNRLALLNVTTGPGGVNALNGVYGAYTDSLGMLVISGQVKNETYSRNYSIPLRQLGDQEVDIISMARPIVKYATILQNPLLVGEVMDKAIFLTNYGRPGPVWIDVPIDIQSALIDPEQLSRFNNNLNLLAEDLDVSNNTKHELLNFKNNISNATVEKIISQLKNSKRPVLFVGSGIRISGMHKSLLALIDQLKIPVVTGWNAHDAVSNDNYYYAGRPGTVGDRPGNFAVQNADFVMILGSRLNIRQVSYNWKCFAKKAWKVMVDIDLAELEKPTLDINLKVHADLRHFIPTLCSVLVNYETTSSHKEYVEWCKKIVVKYPVLLPSYKNSTLINPYNFIDELYKILDDDDVVITGNGSACVITFQSAKLKQKQRLYTNSGSASMGYDLPAAIGASIALGKKRIVCIAGDGSLMMNLQELSTVVGYKLPIKIIVLNNDGYLSIRQTQEAYFPDNLIGINQNNGVHLPDFIKLGEALGIPSIRVKSMKEWQTMEVKKFMSENIYAIIEIVVDPNQLFSPKLSSRKLDDGTMISPSLEDMAPFLSREELDSNLSK